MMVIRPVKASDLDGLMELARSAGVGLTSLPVNEERLSARIARSEKSFSGEADLAERGYVFVLEDTASGRVGGICALEAAVGLKEPWYNYRVGTIVHASEELDVYTRHETLFLHPDFRVNKNGGLLSKSRFLFLAQFPEMFGKVVVAEMRGVSDAAGNSPFWEALGRHFFSMEFAQADYLTGVGQKAFVAELMPKFPVYIDFLPQDAQAVIGQTHDNTRPAVAMLHSEGFRYEGYVDIFDAGPTVQAYTRDIRAVRDSRLLAANVGDSATGATGFYLVSNTGFDGFRVLLAELAPGADSVTLSAEQAATLNIKQGDVVRVVALSPKETA